VQAVETIEVTTLNGFRVRVGGQEIPDSAWRQTKVTLLFKYLLIKKGVAAPQGEILAQFWPDLDLKAARHNFAVTLYTLRRVLGAKRGSGKRQGFIIYERGLCRFNTDMPYQYDAADFEHYAKLGLTADSSASPEEALSSLAAARGIYHTDFLIEDRCEPWIVAERDRLREIYLQVLEHLASINLSLRRYSEAAECARELLRKDPHREETYRTLISALLGNGKRTEAARQYRACQKMLDEEFGLAPAPETKRLYEQIVSGEAM
jgi:DNA-binding SARP family transcriptional activator